MVIGNMYVINCLQIKNVGIVKFLNIEEDVFVI